jgi:hypothetical protein
VGPGRGAVGLSGAVSRAQLDAPGACAPHWRPRRGRRRWRGRARGCRAPGGTGRGPEVHAIGVTDVLGPGPVVGLLAPLGGLPVDALDLPCPAGCEPRGARRAVRAAPGPASVTMPSTLPSVSSTGAALIRCSASRVTISRNSVQGWMVTTSVVITSRTRLFMGSSSVRLRLRGAGLPTADSRCRSRR